jgi:DNA-binding response OmpR family regulator
MKNLLVTDSRDILIVDDDEDLSAKTMDLLTDNGLSVVRCFNSADALNALNEYSFRLLILDVNLPDLTGFELCQTIRLTSNIPIIIISARTSDTDRIIGLDIGGDDYISKPYSLKELLARVNANLRRSYHMKIDNNANLFCFKNFCVNFEARKVTKSSLPLELSTKEFDLLAYLIKHKNVAIQKERIFNAVWGEYSIGEIGTLAVHIRWLREKIEENPSSPKFIITVWGVGYRFEV